MTHVYCNDIIESEVVFIIKWAKKVSQDIIERLYKQDSIGILDDQLADEVGWALYARCESIISVTYGFENKNLICPKCGKDVYLNEEVFLCGCGFRATWEEFRSSYKNKQLYGANAITAFLNYRRDFPIAERYRDKMIIIDTLIHSFHVLHSYRKQIKDPDPADENVQLGRPVGTNIIEGSLNEVILFLDRLSSADNTSETKKKWQSIIIRSNGWKDTIK